MSAEREARSAAGAYVPALDGLRAVAVFAVIAYHLDFGWAQGGYLGVDLFFVLSGYLITSLLVSEWGRSGRIRFGSFWARRARRLLPALALVLLALVLYARLGGPGLDRSALRPDALSTLFYSANWHQVFANQSYFAQYGPPSPLRHTWSLAIEEQFYLLWPLVLTALLFLVRGRRRAVMLVTAVLAVGSAALMALLYHPGADPSRIYYGTDTRAFELLVGAGLAVLLARRPPLRPPARGVLHVAGMASMGVLVYAMVSVGGPPGWLYQGGLFGATVLVAVVIASVVQARSGPLGAVLSLRPLCWIGLISYGLYLWHWPVIALATQATTGVSGLPLKALQVGLTLGLATASYYVVERPIRRARLTGWKRRGFVPVGVGATAFALVFAAILTSTATINPRTARAGDSVSASSVRPAPAAVPPAVPPAELTSVMVAGDSTAVRLAEGIKGPAAGAGLAVHDGAWIGCTIVLGYHADNVSGREKGDFSNASDCNFRTKWPAHLQEWSPKVVMILYGPLETGDHLVNGRWLREGTPEWTSYYDAQLSDMISMIRSQGAQPLIAAVPQFHHTPDADWPNPTYNDPRRIATLNQMYENFAAANSVAVFDLASFVQPSDFTDDGVHFTMEGAARLAGFLDPALNALADPSPARVLPPGLTFPGPQPPQTG